MNKKGFTLMELITTIVIISVLILLASAAVLKHINKTKKEAAYRNAISYIASINDYNFISAGEDLITSGSTSTITPKLKDSFDGTRPKSGSVTVDTNTLKVTSAELHFDGYTVTYNNDTYVIIKD